jgi:hypothetical protein
MMASGEIRLSGTMLRLMPVLAQSGACNGCGTVWADGDGGQTNFSAGVTVTARSESMSEADVASAGMAAAGAGVGSLEAQFGEQFLGSPNGGLYSRAWANGVGRTFRVSNLTKIAGAYSFAAGTVLDLQSLQEGDISGAQFGVNFGLGTLALLSPTYAVGGLNAFMINNVYPGGWQGIYEDFFLDPQNPLVITGGYDGLH